MSKKLLNIADSQGRNNWDEKTDVIVIGSGFAGLTAAIEAKNSGANVMILEKMRVAGGNSVISDGGIAAPATTLQKKIGIVDSAQLMYDDMMKAGLGINDPELVKIVANYACDLFEWSKYYLGVEYLDRIDQFGGHSVPRCYAAKNVSGSTIIKCQLKKAEELGISIRYNTHFDKFIVDSSGRVSGVKVRFNYDYRNPEAGDDIFIKAERGIVLATGGFGADVSFRMIQDHRLNEKIDTTNKPFATAQALKEALRIGAAPVHLSHIQLGPWASPDEKGYGVGPLFADYILFQYGIIINPVNGKRFVNELADRKTVADRILAVGHPCIGIADELAVSSSGWDIQKCLKKGVVKAFNTLEEHSKFYEVPLSELQNTIQDFNNCFKDRCDKSFSKPLIENSAPIENPPFYGMRLWPKVHYTMGGIKINTNASVIDIDGEIISGLYAAGEITGGVHGACRLGSCAITECFVFGGIAGKNAAL